MRAHKFAQNFKKKHCAEMSGRSEVQSALSRRRRGLLFRSIILYYSARLIHAHDMTATTTTTLSASCSAATTTRKHTPHHRTRRQAAFNASREKSETNTAKRMGYAAQMTDVVTACTDTTSPRKSPHTSGRSQTPSASSSGAASTSRVSQPSSTRRRNTASSAFNLEEFTCGAVYVRWEAQEPPSLCDSAVRSGIVGRSAASCCGTTSTGARSSRTWSPVIFDWNYDAHTIAPVTAGPPTSVSSSAFVAQPSAAPLPPSFLPKEVAQSYFTSLSRPASPQPPTYAPDSVDFDHDYDLAHLAPTPPLSSASSDASSSSASSSLLIEDPSSSSSSSSSFFDFPIVKDGDSSSGATSTFGRALSLPSDIALDTMIDDARGLFSPPTLLVNPDADSKMTVAAPYSVTSLVDDYWAQVHDLEADGEGWGW